jgi:hypothetical protein
MLRYDEHAAFQIERRRIRREWVEETLRAPDAIEAKGRRRSYLKCLPRRHFMLRIVTPTDDPEYVITAYFDRTRPCV